MFKRKRINKYIKEIKKIHENDILSSLEFPTLEKLFFSKKYKNLKKEIFPDFSNLYISKQEFNLYKENYIKIYENYKDEKEKNSLKAYWDNKISTINYRENLNININTNDYFENIKSKLIAKLKNEAEIKLNFNFDKIIVLISAISGLLAGIVSIILAYKS